jgi:hypothetical protein
MVILDEILPELSKAKVFTTVDLRAGYWHCPLDTASSLLTTFSTPYGRFRWLRLPFGLCVLSEIFQKRVNQALDGLEGTLNISDDILIYGVGETKEEADKDHDGKLVRLLERCQSKGIVLNPEKLKLRLEEVAFMGHVLTSTGVKIDPDKVKAVTVILAKNCRSNVTQAKRVWEPRSSRKDAHNCFLPGEIPPLHIRPTGKGVQ